MAILKGGIGSDGLAGAAEDDFIYGYAGDDLLSGGDGNDSLRAGEGNDRLFGGAGNDYLDGGEGEDRMEGGAGNDVYIVDNLRDAIVEYAGEGTDEVRSFLQNYTLPQNVEILRLLGSANINGKGNDLNNMLIGNSGDNNLSAGAGDDMLDGRDGNDILNGGSGNDKINGGAGIDTVSYKVFGNATGARVDLAKTTAQNTLHGFDTLTNIENVEGTIYSDVIFGDANDNTLIGLAGSDILRGGAGNDKIYLGDNEDIDRVVFNSAATNGIDSIRNFYSGIDKLVFFAADGYDVSAGFTEGSAAVGSHAQFIWNATSRTLSYDADGEGSVAKVDLAVIVQNANLAAADIEVHAGSIPTIEQIADSLMSPMM